MIFKNKGFTLIELLVVFSIIAVLSSIVLAGLNNARIKANNSRIVQETQQLRNQIEITRTSNGSYPSLMGSTANGGGYILARQLELTANDKFMPLINDILRINGTTYPTGYGGGDNGVTTGCRETYTLSGVGSDTANKLRIFVNGTACQGGVSSAATGYSIYSSFTPVSSGYFCIDSSGKTVTVNSGYAPNTPGSPVVCQ